MFHKVQEIRSSSENLIKVQVTQLKISKPFLKITAKNLNGKDTSRFKALKVVFENTKASEVNLNDVCIVKIGEQFERCRVIQMSRVPQRVTVYLIDCGCTGEFNFKEVSVVQ